MEKWCISWEGEYLPSQMSYLLEDGTLLRAVKSNQINPVINAGGAGERLQKVDWDGNVLWDFKYSNESVRMHHDIEPLTKWKCPHPRLGI